MNKNNAFIFRNLLLNLRDSEQACREYYLPTDRELSSLSMMVTVLLLPPMAFLDYFYYGSSLDFYLVSIGKVLFALISTVIVFFVRRAGQVKTYEAWLFVWTAATSVFAFLAIVLQPERIIENMLVAAIFFIANFTSLPNRLLFRGLPAAILYAALLIAILTNQKFFSFTDKYMFSMVFLVLTVFGIFTISANNYFRKTSFDLQKDEHQKRLAYEALAIEKTQLSELLQKELTDRKQYETFVQVRLRLIQFANAHTLDEFLQKALDEAEMLTDSKISFFHFVEQDKLSLQAWSTRTVRDSCKVEGKGLHYDLADAGVWADCVRERRPIVHNDYNFLPNRKGLPAGHAQVVRELVVPVLRDNHIMAAFGVGNKPKDYTKKDVDAIVYIADVIWESVARKRAEEATFRLNAELEKRVIERTAELEASNRELESLSHNIAHDMRSPVRAMVGYAAMLKESKGEKLDDEGRADLEIIHASAIRLGQLIDDFLAYLRLGRVLIKKQPLSMVDLVRHVKGEILSKNPQRQIQFSLGTLPACQADLSLLEQVWTQLIGNAIKFTRLREVAEIEIDAAEKDGKPCYFIRDNGIGFHMKYAEKIFDIFQHLNPLDDYGGTGAGLAIVRRIIERHGGRIWAEAAVDQGATFYFTLG